jgi:hypothetical protein
MHNDNNLFFKIAFAIIGTLLINISVVVQEWNNAYSQTIEKILFLMLSMYSSLSQ